MNRKSQSRGCWGGGLSLHVIGEVNSRSTGFRLETYRETQDTDQDRDHRSRSQNVVSGYTTLAVETPLTVSVIAGQPSQGTLLDSPFLSTSASLSSRVVVDSDVGVRKRRKETKTTKAKEHPSVSSRKDERTTRPTHDK